MVIKPKNFERNNLGTQACRLKLP